MIRVFVRHKFVVLSSEQFAHIIEVILGEFGSFTTVLFNLELSGLVFFAYRVTKPMFA
tara:strand:+ start:364 stop:537 length:174 start_codon:yes stop_codon:yes gene_type:complete